MVVVSIDDGGVRGGAGGARCDSGDKVEFATQTDEFSEWSKSMLARDEQSLEYLAEADLAYLEMVRTKAGLHHQTAGAHTCGVSTRRRDGLLALRSRPILLPSDSLLEAPSQIVSLLHTGSIM